MKFINLLIILFFLTSCASGVKLNSQFCASRTGVWAKKDEKLKYSASKKIMGFGVEERRIRDILTQRSFNCREVSRMRVRIEQDFVDAFLSLIPGYSSNTVTIEFNLEDS